MKELYHIDGKNLPYIDGIEYSLKHDIDTIFAVPEKNAVGTNALNNAITLLRFDDEKGQIKYDIVRKNFMKYVYGGHMIFMPEFSKDTIGYSQTRGFLLFNIKDKTFQNYTIGKITQIDIDDVFAINPDKNLFLFQLNYQLGIGEKIKVLKLIDLSTENPKELASFDIEKDPLYAELGKTTFYFTMKNGKRELHALNEELKPINHPLYGTYNNKFHESERMGLPRVHPNLPFAVFCEKNSKIAKKLITWVASWRQDENVPETYKIFGDNRACSFQFSPDGKWALFMDDTIKENMLMVMPIDSNLPYFLGTPIILQCNDEFTSDLNGKCAWISNPLSVVATFEDKLVKWDISEKAIHRRIVE